MARRRPRGRIVGLLLALALLAAGASAVGGSRASYPTLPLSEGIAILGNLSGPVVAPGAGGLLQLTVQNPLRATMVDLSLTLGEYAFAPVGGATTLAISSLAPPVLSGPGGTSGTNVTYTWSTLAPGAVASLGVAVATSGSTAAGSFYVRTQLSFSANSTAYLVESRGWFSAGQWAAATNGTGGAAQLNLSLLGVSGLSPESSIVVVSSTYAVALDALLAVGLALVAAGAFLYFRRTRRQSSAGARRSSGASQAASAFGTRRTKDGD